MWGYRLVGVIVVLGLLLGGACGDDDQEPTTSDHGPVLESVSGHPGTELRDGLTVADGSTLIGGVFPDGVMQGEADAARADWLAFLFVSGDPSAVLDAYLGQAEALGMQRVEVPEGQPEYLREDLPVDAQQYTECGVAAEGGPAGYSCSGMAVTDDGAPCLRATLIRRRILGTVESSLQLRYVNDSRGCVTAGVHMVGDPDAAVPSLREEWPEPPAVGEPFGAGFGLLEGIEVAEGSALAAPPLSGDQCFEPVALIAVFDDPLRVLDAYVAQFEQRAPNSERSEVGSEVLADGSTFHQVARVEPAGGNAYRGRLLERDDAPSVLLLTACSG